MLKNIWSISKHHQFQKKKEYGKSTVVKASNQVYGNKILFLLNFSIMWWKEGRAYGTYTGAKNVWGGWFLAGNDNNHKNWVPFILPHNLCLIFMRMKQFFFFFWKKNQNGQLKKTEIFKSAKSYYFFATISGIGPWVITYPKHFWPQCSTSFSDSRLGTQNWKYFCQKVKANKISCWNQNYWYILRYQGTLSNFELNSSWIFKPEIKTPLLVLPK